MLPQRAGAQIDGAVLDVEQPGVGIHLLRQHRNARLALGQFEHAHDPGDFLALQGELQIGRPAFQVRLGHALVVNLPDGGFGPAHRLTAVILLPDLAGPVVPLLVQVVVMQIPAMPGHQALSITLIGPGEAPGDRRRRLRRPGLALFFLGPFRQAAAKLRQFVATADQVAGFGPGPGLTGVMKALVIQFAFGRLADGRLIMAMAGIEEAFRQAMQLPAGVLLDLDHLDAVVGQVGR